MADIFAAIERGDRDGVERIVSDDPTAASARDADGVSAVLTAVYHGRSDMRDLLLAHGLELDIFEASAVGDASRVREPRRGARGDARAIAQGRKLTAGGRCRAVH